VSRSPSLSHLLSPRGHQRERRHRLALAAGGDDADLARSYLSMSSMSMRRRLGDVEQAELAAEAHVLLHRQPERGDLAAVGDRRASAICWTRCRWLAKQAVMMRRPSWACEQVVEHPADGGLAGRVAGLLGVGGVGQQQADAGSLGDGADAGQVGEAPVDRGEVDLEVARVQDHALRGVEGDGEGVGHRVGDRDELDLERSDLDRSPSTTGSLGAVEQPGLLDAVAGEARGPAVP
jgi:hypothetical protein